MKIQIKYHNGASTLEQHGNWVDVYPGKEYKFKAPIINRINVNGEEQVIFDFQMINLKISINLPKHFEALVVPRSSTFKNQGLIQSNGIGIIDGGTNAIIGLKSSDKVKQGYIGDDDIWHFPAIALRETIITTDKPICQFRIQPSMNAPIWIKLKWLFNRRIKFVEVDYLSNVKRGGFGSSDVLK